MPTPIDFLVSMSPNARAALKRAGFEALETAAAQTDSELLALPGFKAQSLMRLRAWEANPDAPPAPTGSKAREEHIRRLYDQYIARGTRPADAARSAIDAVDHLEAELRGAKP